jgi:hypothetical protein
VVLWIYCDHRLYVIWFTVVVLFLCVIGVICMYASNGHDEIVRSC